jgi:hypothetical protein
MVAYTIEYPPLAQMVERLPFKEMVPGSSPGGRTRANKKQHFYKSVVFCLARD